MCITLYCTYHHHHHSCMTGMQSAGLVSFCATFISLARSFFCTFSPPSSMKNLHPASWKREDNDGDVGARQWWLFALEATIISCSLLFSNRQLNLIFANWPSLHWVAGQKNLKYFVLQQFGFSQEFAPTGASLCDDVQHYIQRSPFSIFTQPFES